MALIISKTEPPGLHNPWDGWDIDENGGCIMKTVTGAMLTVVMKGSPVVELPLVALVCGVWLRSVSLDGAGAVSQVSVTDVSPDFIQHPNWTLLQCGLHRHRPHSAQLAGDCTVSLQPGISQTGPMLHGYQGQWIGPKNTL